MNRNALRSLVVLALLLSGLGAQGPIRVATWNVESLGSMNGLQWTAAQAILARIGADVVAIQEVDGGDVAVFPSFASQAGYAYSALSSTSGTLSGGFRGAVLAQHPITSVQSHSAASISGDPSANDITRDILEVHVQPPGLGTPVGLFVVHLKSGPGSDNDFRRAVEVMRLAAVVSTFQASTPGAPAVIAGDFNEDLMDGPFGGSFSSLPSGLPASYSLGSDVTFPVIYDPFATFGPLGFAVADATKEDTTNVYVTRETSGRRLDYLLTTAVSNLGDEVYDSGQDNGFDDPPVGNWLPKIGAPLAPSASLQASDHHAVFADIDPGAAPIGLFINEIDADQAGTDTGEFVELYDGGSGNTSLAGLVLVFFNGGAPGNVSYSAIDLAGSTDAGGYYVVGSPTVPGVDLLLSGSSSVIQNGADAIALYAGSSAAWPSGTAPTSLNLIDAVVYGTGDPPDAALLAALTPGQPQIDEAAGGSSATHSIGRCPDGGVPLVTATWTTMMPSSDQPNAPGCGAPPPFALSISQPLPCGDIHFQVVGAGAQAELFNLIALECTSPPGSGPLFGLSAGPGAGPVLDQAAFPLGTDPFHVLADGSGSYASAILVGGTCVGLSLSVEGVSIEILGGIITQVSPTTGCVNISF